MRWRNSFNSPDAFGTGSSSEPLSGNYVDGVSITYGSPPNHLWTYAAGLSEDGGHNVNFACPCNTNGVPGTVPSYCEAVISGDTPSIRPGWITDDPLWNGMLCRGTEGPCCTSTSLPWFNRNMLNPTADDILIRLCVDQSRQVVMRLLDWNVLKFTLSEQYKSIQPCLSTSKHNVYVSIAH